MNSSEPLVKEKPGYLWMPYEGEFYPRVTHILDNVLNKGEGYLGWVASLGVGAAMAIARQKADEGTVFHKLVVAFLENKAPKIPKIHEHRFKGLEEFLENHEPLEWEHLVVNFDDKYVGTFDLLVRNKKGEIILCDIKTGKSVRKEAELQLSAYRLAYNLGRVINGQGVLWLPAKGKPMFVDTEYQPDVFRAVKKIFDWKNNE